MLSISAGFLVEGAAGFILVVLLLLIFAVGSIPKGPKKPE